MDCEPAVLMLLLLVTDTVDEFPPLAPEPPRLIDAALLPPLAFDVLAPPLPPPPPTDCAKMPLDRSPAVLIAAALLTLTALPLPPSPAAPPMLSDAPTPLSSCSGVLSPPDADENLAAAETVALPTVLPTRPV